MRVISRSRLLKFADRYQSAAEALDVWYRLARKAEWKNLSEVRETFRSADAVGNFTVFNIKGNQYRLIVDIDYSRQRIFLKYVLTHQEYDKDGWKRDPYY